MTIDVDAFYDDLRGKLKAAYSSKASYVRISVVGEASLKRLIGIHDQHLGESEETQSMLTTEELAEMLNKFQKELPKLRQEHMRVLSNNNSIPLNWGERSVKNLAGLKLVVSN